MNEIHYVMFCNTKLMVEIRAKVVEEISEISLSLTELDTLPLH